MAKENVFLPECRYSPTFLSNLDESPYTHIGKVVHVLPKEFLSAEKILTVAGDNFLGFIEESELTMYPITYFETTGIPKFLPKLFGNCITARITDYKDGKFVLSRKSTMEEALQYIEIGQTILSRKTSCTQRLAFLDIGAGISAIIPIQEATSSFIDDISLVLGNMVNIPVKILSESCNNKNMFIASYKQTVPLKEISVGDIVCGRAMSSLFDRSGIFIELSPRQVGIVDTDDLTFADKDYGFEEFKPDIILGNTYSFLVFRIKDCKNNRSFKNYSLKLVK